jgi:AcrR family transcriptional regulator
VTETRIEPTTGEPLRAADCGLRERKRRETRLRLEDCATELILERGFEQVTIDEICDKADVSRRSFFNYFDSKDQVVAGSGVSAIPQEALDDFATKDSDNILRDVLHYIGTTFDNDPDSSLALSPDREVSLRVRARRRTIIRNTPELGAANMHRFDALTGDVLAAMTAHLTNFPENRRTREIPVDEEAILLTGIIRQAIATGGILHRDNPDISRRDVIVRTGQKFTTLAASYSSGWDS